MGSGSSPLGTSWLFLSHEAAINALTAVMKKKKLKVGFIRFICYRIYFLKRSVFFIDLYCQNLHALFQARSTCPASSRIYMPCFKQDLHALLPAEFTFPVSSRIYMS